MRPTPPAAGPDNEQVLVAGAYRNQFPVRLTDEDSEVQVEVGWRAA